ncbi:Alpha/Beta hydrolase protein [Zopfochytrium polystomum]|nr:Alpha/Beta hydrolase protein [Zopfochytrium polystomum]
MSTTEGIASALSAIPASIAFVLNSPSLLTLVYLAWTLLSALLVAVALVPFPPKRFRLLHRHRYALMVIGTLVTEAPQLFLAAKFAALWWFKSRRVFAPLQPTFSTAATDAGSTSAMADDPAAIASDAAVNFSLWSEWVYFLDVGVFLAYWALLLQLYYAKHAVDTPTAVFKSAESTEAPGLWTAAFWFRIMNPFWFPRKIRIHTDICYATDEELNEAGPGVEPFLSLDVYHHPAYPRGRPVLLYIHSGGWIAGSKTFPIPPFFYYLALQKWVVVSINHRLAPASPYPTHLMDVKRALRWVRLNVAQYGGNPDFVAIAGTGSGAHLATMAALTANVRFYQPDFPDVDTSVQACVCINGFFDVSDHKGILGGSSTAKRSFGRNLSYREWFAKIVAGKKGGFDEDEDFFKLSSPVVLLRGLELDRRRTAGGSNTTVGISPPQPSGGLSVPERLGLRSRATASSPLFYVVHRAVDDDSHPPTLLSGENVPPFMVFHGAADSIIPVRHVRDFVSTFKKVIKASITYVEFPAANHMYNIIGARAHYMAYGIERFLNYHADKVEAAKKVTA